MAGAGVTFAFIRVGDGLFEDPRLDENWTEARRVGVVRGAYQFFRPGIDPIDQAEILIRMMGPLEPGDLPPVLDVEATDGESASVIVSRMHEAVRTFVGSQPQADDITTIVIKRRRG